MEQYFVFLSSLRSRLSFPICVAHNGPDRRERYQAALIKYILNCFLQMNKWRDTTMIQSTSISPRRQQRREGVREGRKKYSRVLVFWCWTVGEHPRKSRTKQSEAEWSRMEQNGVSASAVKQWRESNGNQNSVSWENTDLQHLQELPAWCYCCSGRRAFSTELLSAVLCPFYTNTAEHKGWAQALHQSGWRENNPGSGLNHRPSRK